MSKNKGDGLAPLEEVCIPSPIGCGRNPNLQAGVPTFAPPKRAEFQTRAGFTINEQRRI
jgi:hypothetical protein